jgi:hypothetical protein
MEMLVHWTDSRNFDLAKVSSSLKASTIPEAAAPRQIVLGKKCGGSEWRRKGLVLKLFKGNGMACEQGLDCGEKLSAKTILSMTLARLSVGGWTAWLEAKTLIVPFTRWRRAATKDYPRYYKLFQRSGNTEAVQRHRLNYGTNSAQYLFDEVRKT